MGSPLSPIISCIFLELIESQYIFNYPEYINCTWLRYVDDVLFIHPKTFNIEKFHNFINNITPTIKFTIEHSNNYTLPYLDILINWQSPTNINFSIYKKPTHNPKYIHWYSNHSINIKKGVITTLTLRALRICSPHNLNTEIKIITDTFKKLSYPLNTIYSSINKAKKIYSNKENNTNTNNNKFNKYNETLVLNSDINIKHENINIVTKYNNTLKKLLVPKLDNKQESGIYGIPCNVCNKVYIGETIDINRRKYQHSYDLRTYNQSSPLICHLEKEGHMIRTDNLKTLKYIKNHSYRKFYEAYVIKNSNNFNRDGGNYKIDNIINDYLKQSASCDNIKHTLEEWTKERLETNQPIPIQQ